MAHAYAALVLGKEAFGLCGLAYVAHAYVALVSGNEPPTYREFVSSNDASDLRGTRLRDTCLRQ